MKITDAYTKRIDSLIEAAESLFGDEHGHVDDEDHRQECSAWLASAQNIVHILLENPHQPYRQQIDRICGLPRGIRVPDHVGEVSHILSALLQDAKDGLLASVVDQTSAEIFDDFLDHGAEYLKHKRKNEAGAIVGVVFEDAIRRGFRKHIGPDKDISIEDIISALAKQNIISAVKAKRARVAASVRTKATHAQWDEFDLDDVSASFEFTRAFVTEVIDA